MINSKNFRVGILLLVIGISLISYSFYLIWQRNLPVVQISSQNNSISYTDKTPIGISIPSLGLDLPVKPAKVIDGKWEDPKNTIGYWSDSPIPGQQGNSIFYGHNWPNLFGTLNKIKTGDIIQITANDGTIQNFKVAQTYIVTADQTHILNQTEDTRLTIYTCTGFLDSKRFVVIAVPEL